MKRTLSAMKLLVAFLVACAAPIQGIPQDDRPAETPATSALLHPSPTPPAAQAKPTPTEKAKAASTPTVQYSDVPLESGVLLAMWNGFRNELHPVDPRTGQDVSGYEPIRLGRSFWHTFSPDGKTLAAVIYPDSYCTIGCRYGHGLHLIDLQTWHDVKTGLLLNGWISAPPSFSPDGTRLALSSSSARGDFDKQAYSLMIIDTASHDILAQTSLDFAPHTMGYTPDGASLVIYGTDAGLSTEPPRAALIDAADLSVEWKSTLPGVIAGTISQQESDGTESYITLEPAVVLSHDGYTLYIVHADEDKLTTVDFTNRAVRTVEIRPARSWLEQLLALGAGVAHAKGPPDGTTKQAVLSSDGKRLYVVGQTNVTSHGNWMLTRTPHGLQVIDVASGTEIARLDTDATEIRMSPDGSKLYLSSHAQGDEQSDLAVLDTESLDEIHVWSVKGSASWLTAP